MHILLLDQRVAETPCCERAPLIDLLRRDGEVRVSLCSPVLRTAPGEAVFPEGCWPIRLDQLPTVSEAMSWQPLRSQLAGDRGSLSAAAATLSDVQLGLLREAIRRAVTTAVDESDVDVIFVCQAGMLVEFAIETGPPVAAHANGHDLALLEAPGRLREILAASLSSCEVLAADSDDSAALLREAWVDPDPERPIEIWPLTDAAESILAACRTALSRRFTV
ncbi:MAG: hypothetical protein ACO3NZ_09680 [Pirellulales bacterium]|jgi:hypothetical protein